MLFRFGGRGISWMVVFLGNPGQKYDGTRHNAGFRVGDVVAKRCGVKIQRLKNRALTAECELGGQRVLLVKPQTYMNLSGEAVRPLADFYKLPPDRVLVVSDETALTPGRIRLRPGGSAGAPPHPDYEMVDWVLGTFRGEDAKLMDQAAEKAADAIECCISQGIDKAMSLYNAK